MDFFNDFWSIWLIDNCDWLMIAKDKPIWFFLSVHEILFAWEGWNERWFLSYVLDSFQVIRFSSLHSKAKSTSKKKGKKKKKLLFVDENKGNLPQRGLFVNCFSPLYKVKSILLMMNLICSGRERNVFFHFYVWQELIHLSKFWREI